MTPSRMSLAALGGVPPKRQPRRGPPPMVKGKDIELEEVDDWPDKRRPQPYVRQAEPEPGFFEKVRGKTPYGKAAKVLSGSR